MAWPSDLVRTKNWGTEILTDSDLEGQFDVIIAWVMAMMDATTGHDHSGSSNKGPQISPATGLKIASQAQGDVLYASTASAWARLGAGTDGKVLKTKGAAANPIWENDGSVIGKYKNLKVTRPTAATVTVTADELCLASTGSLYIREKSVNVTADITASGANGLDTGSESSGALTVYYIWVIRKSTDGTVAGLLSTSSSAPTMPSGYDQKALVGMVLNDASNNFIDFVQEGDMYSYAAWQTLASGSTAGVTTAIDTTKYVPSALSTYAIGQWYDASASEYTMVGNVTPLATGTDQANQYGGGTEGANQGFWALHILTANTLYWISNAASCIVRIAGFKLNKL